MDKMLLNKSENVFSYVYIMIGIKALAETKVLVNLAPFTLIGSLFWNYLKCLCTYHALQALSGVHVTDDASNPMLLLTFFCPCPVKFLFND